jgi:ferredoxin
VRIEVDRERCQNHGQCCLMAPAVFRLNPKNRMEYDAEPVESERSSVEAAVDICPMQVISLVD